MMSVVRVKPGQMGDSIFMTRLQKGSDPLTVHIPTSKLQVSLLSQWISSHSCDWEEEGCSVLTVFDPVLQNPVSGLLHEMESILAEQKTVSCRNDKSKWWEGRKALDCRVQVSCKQESSQLQSALSILATLWRKMFFSESAQRHGGLVGRLEKPSATTRIRSRDPQTGSAALQGPVG